MHAVGPAEGIDHAGVATSHDLAVRSQVVADPPSRSPGTVGHQKLRPALTATAAPTRCVGSKRPDGERATRWDDTQLAIDWPPPTGGPTLPGKDQVAPLLADQPDLF